MEYLTLKLKDIIKNVSRSINNKRILIVSHELTNTGAPNAILNLAILMKKMNIFIVIYSPRSGPLKKNFIQNGIPVLTFRMFYFKFFMIFFRIFDLIICNTVMTYGYISLLQKKNYNCMWWLHEADFFKSFLRERPKVKDIIKSTKNIYIVSKFAKTYIREYNENIKILNFGIYDVFQNYKINPPGKKITFFLPATIIPVKGQDILIEAFKKMGKEYQDKCEIKFCGLIGDREYYKEFSDNVNNHKNLKYLGELLHEDVLREIAASDALVLPSRGDSYSIITIEALMFGKPVIISNKTGVSEFINDGENGFIFNIDRINELTRYLKMIIDDPFIIKQSKARNLFLNEFDMKIYKEKIKSVLKDLNVM